MDRRYWVGFNLIKGIGSVRFKVLLEHFGDLEYAWQAPMDALRAAGLSEKLADHVVQARKSVDLDTILENAENRGIRILTWQDAEYPARLKEIDQPPPVLYVRGALTTEDEWSVAIVGTRRVSAYGRQVTEEIASFLGANRITVISGLARGVDSIAHDAALKAGGRTLAILGSGVDQIYPPEHRALADRMINTGAILSDYAMGTPPDASNFPPRNRIISGMSLATIVVEAGETSGALITAQFALEQGREVYAVPGNVYAPQSKGTNRLIAQGAHPFVSGQELLECLDLQRVTDHRQVRKAHPADEVEAKLLDVLSLEPMHVDEIHARTGLPIERISAALTMMVLKGLAKQSSGMNFMSVHEEQTPYRVEKMQTEEFS